MPYPPVADNWTDFRKVPLYRETLKDTAEAFIALYRISGPHKRVYRTATQQLAQAPMEYDGGNSRYLRARWRLPSYSYGDPTHGEHPFTKKVTKDLIAKAITQGVTHGADDCKIVDVIMEILDCRQDTVLMIDGNQKKSAGLILPMGDGFVERYLPKSDQLIDRSNGALLDRADIEAIQQSYQERWLDAINSL